MKKTAEEIAQWVIDNRYAKSENNKIDDRELYDTLVNEIKSYRSQVSELPSDEDVDMYEALVAIKDYCKYWDIRLGSGIIKQVEDAITKGKSSIASRDARIKELEEALKVSEEIVSELNRGYNRFM